MKSIIQLQRSSSNVTINSAFEQFIRAKRNMNLSEESIGFYQDSIRYFTDFFVNGKYCYDITLDVVEDYVAYQKSKDISSVTVNTYLRGLRAILYFFMERDYMPKFKIKLIRQEKKVKNTYTDAELKLLLAKPTLKNVIFRNIVIGLYQIICWVQAIELVRYAS